MASTPTIAAVSALPSESTPDLETQRAKASKFVNNELLDAYYRVSTTQNLINAARTLLEAERLTLEDCKNMLDLARKIEEYGEKLRDRADELWTMVHVLEELMWKEVMAEEGEE
jgi:hypothetical protein